MRRRDFVRLAGAGGAALLALPRFAARAQPGDQPNVLFFIMDDTNDWIGYLGGHADAVTPNLDAFAQSGVRFDNAHANSSACIPSRTSMFSGLRPSSTGVYNNAQDWHDYLPNHLMMPSNFRVNGYHTLRAGKFFHPSETSEYWDEWTAWPTLQNPPNFPLSTLPHTFDWYDSFDSGSDIYILLLNAVGDVLRDEILALPNPNICYDAVAVGNAGFALCGVTYLSEQETPTPFLIRIDANGDTVWTQSYDELTPAEAHAIAVGENSHLFVAGHSRGIGDDEALLFEADQSGSLLWHETYSGEGNTRLLDIAISEAGQIHAVGFTSSAADGATDFYRVHLSTGDAAREQHTAASPVPGGFELNISGPNPFNSTTSVTVELPAAARVTITLYDRLGRRVDVPHSGRLMKGRRRYTIAGNRLASGVYLVRATAPGGFDATRKIVLMK